MRACYNVNTRKALETILWFPQQRSPIDFSLILKVLFFADKKHLNEYGRPILGDTYDAYPHGPVARTVYRLFKLADPLEAQFLAEDARLKHDDYPFVVTRRCCVSALRPPNLAWLSDSDIDALEWAFKEYGDKSFAELERLTHQERAWCIARERGTIIEYEDMLEVGEKRAAQDGAPDNHQCTSCGGIASNGSGGIMVPSPGDVVKVVPDSYVGTSYVCIDSDLGLYLIARDQQPFHNSFVYISAEHEDWMSGELYVETNTMQQKDTKEDLEFHKRLSKYSKILIVRQVRRDKCLRQYEKTIIEDRLMHDRTVIRNSYAILDIDRYW
jgi:uncharacterized phage-associated protein